MMSRHSLGMRTRTHNVLGETKLSNNSFVAFLEEVMRRRRRLPSQLAADLGISHATVIRWMSGESVPSTSSCRKLAEYSGVPLQKVLYYAGHTPRMVEHQPDEWPEFGEYVRRKYPQLDEDLIIVIENLIESKR